MYRKINYEDFGFLDLLSFLLTIPSLSIRWISCTFFLPTTTDFNLTWECREWVGGHCTFKELILMTEPKVIGLKVAFLIWQEPNWRWNLTGTKCIHGRAVGGSQLNSKTRGRRLAWSMWKNWDWCFCVDKELEWWERVLQKY